MNYHFNELTADKLEAYEMHNAIDVDFIKICKVSPSAALNRVYRTYNSFESIYKHYLCGTNNFDLLRDQVQAKKMKEELKRNSPQAFDLINGCLFDVSLYSEIEIGDHTINVKARFEAINPAKGLILGFKFDADCSPEGTSRNAGLNGDHIEAAFLLFLARKLFNKEFQYIYITQETLQPFNNALYKVSDNMRIRGEHELLELLPAAAQIKASKQPLSYSVFCPNESGIFDLDIEEGTTTQRAFNF